MRSPVGLSRSQPDELRQHGLKIPEIRPDRTGLTFGSPPKRGAQPAGEVGHAFGHLLGALREVLGALLHLLPRSSRVFRRLLLFLDLPQPTVVSASDGQDD